FREVLTLHYHAGLSTEEIADWTGLSRETVKKRLQRARSALSELTLHTLLEPAEQEEEKRRKRVMALLLLLPVDWQGDAAPGKEAPPQHRLAQPDQQTARIPWSYVALAVAAGAALLLLVGSWLWPTNTVTPAPSITRLPQQVAPAPTNAGGTSTKENRAPSPPPEPRPISKGKGA
ncbi:MAG: hypothetical protein K1Y02_19100, partial [Candidatus Hydrogenedentes bacterium]|nr:hypothetical protein [Candidatus Hydrogenedentota bacterium]